MLDRVSPLTMVDPVSHHLWLTHAFPLPSPLYPIVFMTSQHIQMQCADVHNCAYYIPVYVCIISMIDGMCGALATYFDIYSLCMILTLEAPEANDNKCAKSHAIIGTAFGTGNLHVWVFLREQLTICHEGSPCTGINAAIKLLRKCLGVMREIDLAFDAGAPLQIDCN